MVHDNNKSNSDDHITSDTNVYARKIHDEIVLETKTSKGNENYNSELENGLHNLICRQK